MTKISKKSAYPKKTPVVSDYFVGTDSENNLKTVNFGFEETAKLINELTGTSILNYLFKTSNNIPLEVLTEGVFLSDENETSIAGITKLFINKKNFYDTDLTDLFRFMSTNKNEFLVTLRNSNNLNNTVYFNIVAITEFADSFTFEVSTYFSNAAFTDLVHFNIYFFNFELKSVGGSSGSDPLKLDKSTYAGNAADLDERLVILENQTDLDNVFIIRPAFSLVDNTLIIEDLGKWKLDGTIYENTEGIEFPITFCSPGKIRLDYFVPNTDNGFTKVSGIETLGIAIPPQLPNEGLYVTYVLVSDSGVSEPVVPPTVVIPNIDQVLGSGFSTTKFIWFSSYLNSFCTRFANDHILFQKLESVFNFIRSDNTTESYTVQLPNKLGGAGETFAMVSDLTKSNVGLGNVDNTSDASKPVSTAQAAADAVVLASAQSYTDSKVSSVYVFKGNVANYAALPSTGLTIGDVYNLSDTGENYAWTGTVWDNLGTTIDVSGKENVLNKTDTVIGNETSSSLYASIKGMVDYFTASKIKSLLGITTLSGNNTGDQDLSGYLTSSTATTTYEPIKGSDDNYVTDAEKTALGKDTISMAMSDGSTALVTGDTDPMQAPYNFNLSNAWAGVKTAPTVSSLIVDIKKNGVSITSTKIGIDANEKTSLTGTTPVFTTTSFTKGDEITGSIYQVGSGETGRSLKLYLEIIKT